MTDHDPRCERSASDPRRCRCQCKGRHHGEFATPIDLRHRQAPPQRVIYRNDDEFDWSRADLHLAARADAALAEGVPL